MRFSRIKSAVVAGVLAIIGVEINLVTSNAHAVNCPGGGIQNTYAECGMHEGDSGASGLDEQVRHIINGVLYVVGVLAVVMVIVGGVKYTTSGGDQAAVTSAKNTILYGIVGLVIAILAYAIANFVIGKVAG